MNAQTENLTICFSAPLRVRCENGVPSHIVMTAMSPSGARTTHVVYLKQEQPAIATIINELSRNIHLMGPIVVQADDPEDLLWRLSNQVKVNFKTINRLPADDARIVRVLDYIRMALEPYF